MAYESIYRPINLHKYEGNPNRVFARSLWERGAFKYADLEDRVIKWGSEQYNIPYRCKTDGRRHTYYIDMHIWYVNDPVMRLIEIKPERQTKAPPKRKRSKSYVLEVLRYAKNVSKWKAAHEFAQANGYKFELWTEHHLRALGIPIPRF